MRKEQRLNVRAVDEMLHMNRESVPRILKPKVLSNKQKERRNEICFDLLERTDGDPSFLKSVDETWIFTYTKKQSLHWKIPSSPRAKKAHMSSRQYLSSSSISRTSLR